MAKLPKETVERPDKNDPLKEMPTRAAAYEEPKYYKPVKASVLDNVMMLVIFVATLIACVSWLTPYDDVGDGFSKYLVFYYPLYTTLEIIVLSLFFVLRAIRKNICIYAKIATFLFMGLQLINLLTLFVSVGLSNYLVAGSLIINVSIATLIGIYVIKRK